MAIWQGFGKKNQDGCGCCCGNFNEGGMEQAKKFQSEGSSIKILGAGCSKCEELTANVAAAIAEMGKEATIDHITDFSRIASYGVMTTPALVVDGKIISYGKVLKKEEIIKLLTKTE